MRTIRQTWTWLAEEPRQRTGIRVLQIAVGLMLLFRIGTEARFAAYFWGPNGLGLGSTKMLLGAHLGGAFDHLFHSMVGVYALLVLMAGAAIALVHGYQTRWAALVALIVAWALELRMPEIVDGGDNITRLVLGYMLLLCPPGTKPARGSVTVWLHNLGVVAIGAQVLILYTTAGFMKAAGTRWHHGTALYLISQVEWFSVPAVRSVLKQPFITAFATYATTAYQVWFPVAMMSPLKRVWLLGGILLHVSIAGVMGLVTFSTVMIGLELFLLSDAEWAELRVAAFRLRLQVSKLLARREPVLAVFYDGFCPFCQRVVRAWARLDFRRAMRMSSFRHEDRYSCFGIEPSALESRMHVVDVRDGAVYSGFEAIRIVARVVPWLWPLRPMLFVASKIGIGERVYEWVATRREIVPDARHCDEACAIGGTIHERA